MKISACLKIEVFLHVQERLNGVVENKQQILQLLESVLP